MTCREFAGFLDAYLSGARSARAVTHLVLRVATCRTIC
jgi:hypothetical protein